MAGGNVKSAQSSARASATVLFCASGESIFAHPALSKARRRFAGIITANNPKGSFIAGLPVLGHRLDAESLTAAKMPVSKVALLGVADRLQVRAFLGEAAALGLRPLILGEHGKTRGMQLADTVGASAFAADWAHMRAVIAGKRVLVTGAGGSIGSEICRQLAALWPARLTLLDSSEFNLYSIDHELAAKAPALERGRVLCDIRDGDAVRRWFTRERPDFVLHAAALKHVPMVEEFPCEGALTNMLGTRNVVDACAAIGAHMLLVSTDKAANPASAMGATKRTAEMLCQAKDVRSEREGDPRFIVARLGNVLGSAGSVTPMFEKQIAAGGPVTITDPDAARYFITIPQAAAFLVRALVAGVEGEASRGAALVLDMGEPVKVIDLARDMIRLKGLRPDIDIPIKIVGLRPGEKLIEQLIDENEIVEHLHGEGMMAAHSAPRDLPALRAEIDRITTLARAGHDDFVRSRLLSLVSQQRLADLPFVAAGG